MVTISSTNEEYDYSGKVFGIPVLLRLENFDDIVITPKHWTMKPVLCVFDVIVGLCEIAFDLLKIDYGKSLFYITNIKKIHKGE